MVPGDQIAMGIGCVLVCAAGLWFDRWFLAETAKGRALAQRLGEERGLWVLRVLFGGGIVFGVLLATGIVNPIQWN